MKLLIDTCTFLWILGGGRALPARVAQLYQSADNEVYLSAVSAWEITVKHTNGRLALPEAPERLVPAERDRRGIMSLAFDEESALHASRLPSSIAIRSIACSSARRSCTGWPSSLRIS